MSSHERLRRSPGAGDELPPGLSAMWRLCRLGFRYEPALMGTAFVLALAAALPDALLAVWFALLGKGLLENKPGLLWFAIAALAVSVVATWLLQTVSTRIQRRFRDKVTIALESHVARLQATIGTIAHQERPEYLDRLYVLREQIFTLDHMYYSVFSTAGWILRLAITVALLATVNPVLILLTAFAVPTVAATSWRPVVERTAQERGAQADRLARHVFTLSTTASPGKELRVLGVGPALAQRRRASWEDWYGPVGTARTRSAAWYAGGWAIFGLGYTGAIVLVTAGPHASASAVFEHAGTCVLREGDLYLMLNASGAGLKGRGAHGHNDALSIEVSACGVSFIADPGTYVYTSDLRARQEFRSTAYHSTVEIDGVEQNTTGERTPFQLGDESRPRVLDFARGDEEDFAVAEHYGYARLTSGAVTHRRAVRLVRAARCFLVEDTFEGAGEHDLSFIFHAAPGLEVARLDIAAPAVDGGAAAENLEPVGVEIRDGSTGARLVVVSLEGFESLTVEPRQSSRGYGSKIASSASVWHLRATLPLRARWLLVPVRAGEDERARLELALSCR